MNNPYLLLLFSKKLRGYFLSMITCGRAQGFIGQSVELGLKMTLDMKVLCRKSSRSFIRGKCSKNRPIRRQMTRDLLAIASFQVKKRVFMR